MFENDYLFEDFLKKIKELISKIQVNGPNQKEIFKPKEFLKNQCTLYKRFYQESMNLIPDQVVSFFLKHLKNTIHSIATNSIYPSIEQVHFTLVILALFRVSIETYSGKDDILKESQHLLLIEIGSETLKADNCDKSIKNGFLSLITSSSHKSPSQVITFIYELDKSIEQQTPAKEIEWLFNMILYSISDIEALEIMISNIHTIENINPQYYTNIIELIQESFHRIIHDNPESYDKFFTENKESQNIIILYSKINSWGSFENLLMIKSVLYLLQPLKLDVSSFDQSDLCQTFMQINVTQEPLLSKIIGALKIIFETYLYTNVKKLLSPFITELNSLLIEYYKTHHSKLPKNTTDFFATTFPACLLFISPYSFDQIFLPILQREDDYAKKFSSIISTACPQIKSNKQAFYDIYGQVYKPINELILIDDKDVNLVLQSIKASPQFYRSFIYENSFAVHKIIENGIDISYFDLFYSDIFHDMPVEAPFWSITKCLTDNIVRVVEKSLCDHSSPDKGISSNYTKLFASIINFIQCAFQSSNLEYLKDELTSILYNVEAIIYALLSISKKSTIAYCKNVLGYFYTIMNKVKLQIGISTEKIYALGTVCKVGCNICKEFAAINKKYMINDNIQNIPKGWELAISILLPRFEMLTRILLNENNYAEGHDQQNQNSQYQELQELQNQNLSESSDSLKPQNTRKYMKELKSCIYVLFSLLRQSSTSIEELIYLILDNNDKVGHACTPTIAESLSPTIYYNIIQMINTNFTKLAKKNNLEGINNSNNNKAQASFVENSLRFIKILLDNSIWLPNPNYSTLFTSIINNTILLCAQINLPTIDNLFCQFIISLFELTVRANFEIQIDSKVRNSVGRTIVSWINRIQTPENDSSFELYYLALYSILNGIDFHECKSGDVLNPTSDAHENFLFYYSQRRISDTLISTSVVNNERKTSLLLSNSNKVIDCVYFSKANQNQKNDKLTLSILNPILKNNFDLCINHIISQAFDPRIKVRVSFMNALSSALSPETYQKFVNPVINKTVVDLIFENDFEILQLLAKESPYKSGEIAEAIVKASALKKIEMKVFEELVKIEISNNKDPTRNTLFRGNGITSRAISYFPKYFADKWANDLIAPLLSLDKSNLKTFWNAMIRRIEEMFVVIPDRMKEAIRILFALLSPESTEIAFSIISGFVFLRFLCPLLAKEEGLVDASSLLMSASIRPTIGENRPQFMHLKAEVADSYQRIQKLYQNIVAFQLFQKDGINYKPPPIEIKPLNPPPDSEAIIADLIAALWSQMPFIQKSFHQIQDDLPVHATLDLLIAQLKKAGNPHRKISPISISEVLNFSGLLSPPLIELLQTNQQEDPSLENWFYLSPIPSRDGSFIFIMDMSQIKQPFTAQQLCAYAFSQVLSIGDAKYSVFVEFSGFDVELLPPLSQIKKTVKLATNEMISRLGTVYVARIQDNSVSYLNKASKLLKKLPLKSVTDMKMIRDEIGELKIPQATSEFFSSPEASYQLQEKSNYPIIRLHQKSIHIIDKVEINQIEYFTSNVIQLSCIENIGPSQTTKTTSTFTIRTKSGKSHNIQFPASTPLRRAVYQLYHRFNEEKEVKKLYVDRSSFSSLLLILCFLNMLNDNGDQELKASALNLYNTTIDSSGLKTGIEKKYFSKNEIPFSMLQLVEVLARDLAFSNPNEVHSFFFEYVKAISFFDYRDYASSERFLQPWIQYAAEQIITNPTTLNCLAQISTNAPKKYFMQFNKSIWQNFSRIDLLGPLFTKMCNFEESNFASVFLSIAVKYPTEVTDFLVGKLSELATDLTQRPFTQVSEILSSMIVGKLFDKSYETKVLHKIALIRLIGSSVLSKSCFKILQTLFSNPDIDTSTFSCSQSLLNFIHDDVDISNNSNDKQSVPNNNSNLNQRGDYRQFVYDTVKLSLLYREHYSETLFDLFMSDMEGLLKSNSSSLTDTNVQNDLIPKLNGIIFISTLENDYSIAFEVYKLFYNFNPYKTLPICSMSLALSIGSIPNNILFPLFFTSIASLLYTDQTTSFDLIYSIFKVAKISFIDVIRKIPAKNLQLFDSITNLSFSTQPLLSFLLVILNFYGRGKIDLPNIICQPIFNDKSQNNLILSLFQFQFDETLENKITTTILNNSNLNNPTDISATIILLYLWHPLDHMKRLLMKMLESHPDYFANINFSSFYSRNANQFKFVDTELMILLVKATYMNPSNVQHNSEKKYQLHPIIASTFAGNQISSMSFDQAKSIFHVFFSS